MREVFLVLFCCSIVAWELQAQAYVDEKKKKKDKCVSEGVC